MKKIVSFILCLVMLAGLVPTFAAASGFPFTDVKSGSWYYGAVRWCCGNGYLSGTSDTVFSPHDLVNRAQAVTVAWHIDGSEEAGTDDKTPFADVLPERWYTDAVIWAKKNGVTSGITDTEFAPDQSVTREQLVAFLYKFAAYKGSDVSASASLDRFTDAASVSGWAKTAVKWAVASGMISGKGGGKLAPKDPATRAELAVIIKKFIQNVVETSHEHLWGNWHTVNKVTVYNDGDRARTCLVCKETETEHLPALKFDINGNDITLYTIVYGEEDESRGLDLKEQAEKLAWYLYNSYGVTLPVVSDATEPTDFEIIVGRTNREDAGLVTVDRDSFESDQQFICQVQGSRLVICGIDSDSHDGDHDHKVHNVDGTRNAVYYFGENYLGVETYSESNGGIYLFNPAASTDLSDGWTYTDGPYLRCRRFFMSGGILGTGTYMAELTYCMSTWIDGDFSKEEELIHDPTPCLSDENNLQAVIRSAKKALDAKPYIEYLGIGINDDNEYCMCEKCRAAYRAYGSRSAALMLFVNKLSDALAEDYPGVKILTGAYTYTEIPPVGITMNDNVMIEYYTINACYNHAYTDKNCSLNKNICDNVDGWNAIANELWLWDHCCNFNYSMTPVPDWDSMLENIRYFADSGATQVLMNSLLGGGYRYSDFGYFRGYMLSNIYLDPYMSEEEFNDRMDRGLAAYYGSGWRNIREYLDTICELGNHVDHNMMANPTAYYDMDEVAAVADHLDALWDEAIEIAINEGDDDAVTRLVLAQHSWIFLRQCAVYNSRYLNGTDEQRAAYDEANLELLKYIEDNEILWTEGSKNALDGFGPGIPPSSW